MNVRQFQASAPFVDDLLNCPGAQTGFPGGQEQSRQVVLHPLLCDVGGYRLHRLRADQEETAFCCPYRRLGRSRDIATSRLAAFSSSASSSFCRAT